MDDYAFCAYVIKIKLHHAQELVMGALLVNAWPHGFRMALILPLYQEDTQLLVNNVFIFFFTIYFILFYLHFLYFNLASNNVLFVFLHSPWSALFSFPSPSLVFIIISFSSPLFLHHLS